MLLLRTSHCWLVVMLSTQTVLRSVQAVRQMLQRRLRSELAGMLRRRTKSLAVAAAMLLLGQNYRMSPPQVDLKMRRLGLSY
jgi:hypothetical protein